VEYVLFKTDYLQQILCANLQTVNLTITDRGMVSPKMLLLARKLDKWTWRLRTLARKSELADLYVPPGVLQAFERGELMPMEMLYMTAITSFTRKGKCFFGSNKWLGQLFGISPQRSKQIVRQLRNKRCLTPEYLPHNDLFDQLLEQDQFRFKRRRGRTSRILWPPHVPGFYKNVSNDGEAGFSDMQ
jgi:hypothetical protein